jgi:hypothetical protein
MTTVRITDKLRAAVTNNIQDLYHKFVEQIEKQKPDVGDELYNLMYEPHREAMALLPECFFCRRYEIELRKIVDKPVYIKLKLSSPQLGSYGMPSNEHMQKDDYHDRVILNRTIRTEHIVDALLAWQEQKDTLHAQRDAAQAAVRGVLKWHKSLPPAIKDFPPLVEFLPKEVKSKVSVPQHRLSSVTMELDPALKELATRVAIDKMLNQ